MARGSYKSKSSRNNSLKHYLLTLVMFQTCMTFFLFSSVEHRSYSEETVLVKIDFHGIYKNTMIFQKNIFMNLFSRRKTDLECHKVE